MDEQNYKTRYKHNVSLTTMELLLPVLLFASAPMMGAGISCYVCNSRHDTRCLDPFQVSNSSGYLSPVDCENNNNVRTALETVTNLLAKLGQTPYYDKTDLLAHAANPTDMPIPTSCQKIDLTVLGESVTGRGCSVHEIEGFTPCDTVKLVTSSDVQIDFCGVCTEDGCNGAATVNLSQYAFLTTMVINVLVVTVALL